MISEKRLKILLTVITVGWILVIFINSLMSGEASSKNSDGVLKIINDILAVIKAPFSLTSYTVRKSAHFLEYAVLGGLAFWTLRGYTKRMIYPLYFGLAVPVADECIQLFSNGRAGMVEDVVLDYSGFLTGLWLMFGVYMLIRRLKYAK